MLATRPSDARALAARTHSRIVYLGSGALKGLARESALKVLELTAGRLVAYSDSSLGFRHGPKAVFDERTVVVVYLSNDPYTRQYDQDIVAELRRAFRRATSSLSWAGMPICRLAGKPGSCPVSTTWTTRCWPCPQMLCAQLIGLEFSLALGCTSDNPFPSGDVNRVVQGVTLHALHS